MPLYRPSELRVYLQKLGTVAKKRFSQNFLIDGNIINKIIKVADVSSDDLVLEIGPGPGALTEALLNAGSKVIAVEKDPIFAHELSSVPHLQTYCEDILSFPLDERIVPGPGKKAKVVANIPYSLTSPLLGLLVPMNHLFSSLTLMVQDEVAKRCTAKPGSRDYSPLTVFLNYYGTTAYRFMVGRKCFYPPPKVDSAIITIDLHAPRYGIDDSDDFFLLVKTAFQQRRKTLVSSLRSYSDSVKEALVSIGERPDVRPEKLSLEKFISLYKTIR